MFSLDIAVLNDLLDAWPIENCDPAWMLRKAALLTEVGRHDESMTLVQDALNSIRKDLSGYKNIASASREGWALASKLTLDNKQEVFARWDELTSLKCDAWMEIDYLARAMTGTEQQKKAPSFDLGSRRGARIRISNERRDRVMAAYRAVRLPEVAGLPPVNRSATGVPNVAAYRILALAAVEIVSVNPNLAMRLALRICTYDRDEMLQRVLSRTRVATLSDESAKTLAEVCIGVIEYILPRLPTLGSHRSEFSWIERMQVAMEALSRLVLRLSPEMATTAFDVGLVCYQTPQVVQHSLLVSSLGSVLKRSWQAIPSKLRVKYALTALRLPIAGADGFVADSDLVDPAEFVGIDDLPTERTTHHEGSYRELVSHLARALSQNDEARERATLRLLLLASKQCLTNDELLEIAEALWSKQDPIRNNTRGPNSPWDWVYLILPQLEYGQAEKSFRGKWLGGGSSEAVESSHSSERLAQVGYAIEGLHSNDSPLLLSTEERDLLLNGIVEIVEMLSSTSVSFDTSIESAIRGIRSIGAEITIPSEIAEHLFARVEILLSTENEPEDAWFQPVYDVRIAIGFALVPGLVKALPDRVDTIALLLRRALASDDDLLVGRAMSVLQYWLSESNWTPGTILDDLVKEVGAIIASRRRVALVDALLCATYVFDRGTLSYQETIRQLVLDGLSYLAEELRYDRDHGDSDEVPTLRLLCVRLARHMARHGLEDNPTVSKWLDIGRNDPFPEIRMAVTDG